MKQKTWFNHVAYLVPSVAKAAHAFASAGLHLGPVEEWDGEGTREIYIGEASFGGRLLLMEPLKEGPYTRALAKRGPGLHHVAIDVENLEDFVTDLSGTGWFLHPKSLLTIKQSRTAWLARPGTPMLIEIHEIQKGHDKPLLVTRVEHPLKEDDVERLEPLGLKDLFHPSEALSAVVLNQQRFSFHTLT